MAAMDRGPSSISARRSALQQRSLGSEYDCLPAGLADFLKPRPSTTPVLVNLKVEITYTDLESIDSLHVGRITVPCRVLPPYETKHAPAHPTYRNLALLIRISDLFDKIRLHLLPVGDADIDGWLRFTYPPDASEDPWDHGEGRLSHDRTDEQDTLTLICSPIPASELGPFSPIKKMLGQYEADPVFDVLYLNENETLFVEVDDRTNSPLRTVSTTEVFCAARRLEYERSLEELEERRQDFPWPRQPSLSRFLWRDARRLKLRMLAQGLLYTRIARLKRLPVVPLLPKGETSPAKIIGVSHESLRLAGLAVGTVTEGMRAQRISQRLCLLSVCVRQTDNIGDRTTLIGYILTAFEIRPVRSLDFQNTLDDPPCGWSALKITLLDFLEGLAGQALFGMSSFLQFHNPWVRLSIETLTENGIRREEVKLGQMSKLPLKRDFVLLCRRSPDFEFRHWLDGIKTAEGASAIVDFEQPRIMIDFDQQTESPIRILTSAEVRREQMRREREARIEKARRSRTSKKRFPKEPGLLRALFERRRIDYEEEERARQVRRASEFDRPQRSSSAVQSLIPPSLQRMLRHRREQEEAESALDRLLSALEDEQV